MLTVKKPEEVNNVILENFESLNQVEEVSILQALGRILAIDVMAKEDIPSFNRSTVDGYAVCAKDTFGASESNAIIFRCVKEIAMGEVVTEDLQKDECMYVPTGGMIPQGADGVVMIEHTENYGHGEVGILKAASPSENVIFKGEDAKEGQIVVHQGCKLTSKEIGCLADLGYVKIPVEKKLTIGIISTGDELIEENSKLELGKIRDVNTSLLSAFVMEQGCEAVSFGIVKDDEEELRRALKKALDSCHMVLISGGSSAGFKDKTAKVIESLGELFFHGIAMKPGKPTILGKAQNKPIFGLPGHPVAAYYISKMYVSAAIARLQNRDFKLRTVPAVLTENISANQGRALCVAVRLENKEGKLLAFPVRSKSGLIAAISETDGFVLVSRSSEGVEAGGCVDVISIFE